MTAEGAPGPGWWRSGDAWYPPEQLPQGWSVGPDGVPRSFEYPPAVAVQAPTPASARWAHAYDRWPTWAKAALPIAALVLAGGTVAVALRDDGNANDTGELAALSSTRDSASGATTTRRVVEPSVSVAGLVVTPPPTLRATSTSSTASTRPTTSRGPLGASPSGGGGSSTGTAPSTTVAPTVGATTTTTTTIATTTTTTTTTATTTTTTSSTTTRPPTSTSTASTASTTSSTTTRAATTTTTATTTRPATTTVSTTTTRAVTHTVEGTLLVDDRIDVNGVCGGRGQFASFRNGQTIALLDGASRIVGQGVLANCQWTDWRFTNGRVTAKPTFTFTIAGVPEVESYRARVGSTTWPSVSLTTLRNAGWRLALEVD
jgi:hypothetical protein